nr:hypothetical protein [Neobacillus sp. Marseille-Q6967]
MSVDISKLGMGYDNLEAAAVDKSPSEVVITNNDETYYIVTRDVYEDGPQQNGFKIVVNEGE